MARYLKSAAIGLLIGCWVVANAAAEITAKETNKEPVTREQIKALDQQVQDIKKDVLGISTELTLLEDKLIYPANTQISIFLSVAQGERFRLDAVKIKMDGKAAAHHIYSPKEMDALQHGGVQRIYTGNIRTGEHALAVALSGKSASNKDYQQNASYKFTKDAGTKLIEITVTGSGSSDQSIFFKD